MSQINHAVQHLKQGHIIAYPTEAVFGLGCDPFNEQAVHSLLKLKNRESSKGFILIVSNWEQINPLIKPIPEQKLIEIKKTWPGPITWVFPASKNVPSWITGENQTIALRMTSHPIAKSLCDEFQKAIVSTSANTASNPPARTIAEVKEYFENIDYILTGKLGNLSGPTPIRDALTGTWYRY